MTLAVAGSENASGERGEDQWTQQRNHSFAFSASRAPERMPGSA